MTRYEPALDWDVIDRQMRLDAASRVVSYVAEKYAAGNEADRESS